MNSDAHRQQCIGERADLLDHASLFVCKGNRLLIAFTYRPGPDDLGHASYLDRVNKYTERLGIAAYIPDAAQPIHALYATDATALLYGPRGQDLAPFVALPLGLSPNLDRTTARLTRDRERAKAHAQRMVRERAAARRVERS
jgi:hypothetical protein